MTFSGFIIEKRVGDDGTWSEAPRVNSNVSTYTDTGLAVESGYYYRVCAAYEDTLTSQYTEEVYAFTLAAPDTFEAKAIGSNRIRLNWNNRNSYDSGAIIERKIGDNGVWSELTRIDSATYTYDDSYNLVQPENGYYYRICAYNDQGKSSYTQ